jgi:hypothetical protein
MKKLLFFVMLLPTICNAQKKFVVLISGDTVRKGTLVKISTGSNLTSIYPSGKTPTAYRNIYMNYLNNRMQGNTYSIERVTEFTSDKRKVAIFSVKDNSVSFESMVFYINLDRAIELGEITFVNK